MLVPFFWRKAPTNPKFTPIAVISSSLLLEKSNGQAFQSSRAVHRATVSWTSSH